MASIVKPPRILFWISVFILLIASGAVYFFSQSQLPPSIEIDTHGQPTIGYPKARVHVVIFEELKCSNCRDYNAEIFPVIKKDFIDTNKIQYTVIPVSFLPGSMPAAVAALCVYHDNPLYPNNELFFKYLKYIFEHQPGERVDWATPTTLVDFAKATSPVIKPEKLKKCIEMQTYRVQIEKNTAYGKRIMGGVISTPTVYVNGMIVKELSVDGVSKLINEALEHEGVY